MCWHSWKSLREEALREWTSWAGGIIAGGGLIAVWFFPAVQLIEFGGRVAAMGGIVAGLLLILKRAKGGDP